MEEIDETRHEHGSSFVEGDDKGGSSPLIQVESVDPVVIAAAEYFEETREINTDQLKNKTLDDIAREYAIPEIIDIPTKLRLIERALVELYAAVNELQQELHTKK
jgi:hypothetical protein